MLLMMMTTKKVLPEKPYFPRKDWFGLTGASIDKYQSKRYTHRSPRSPISLRGWTSDSDDRVDQEELEMLW